MTRVVWALIPDFEDDNNEQDVDEVEVGALPVLYLKDIYWRVFPIVGDSVYSVSAAREVRHFCFRLKSLICLS